jgi:MFS family permease
MRLRGPAKGTMTGARGPALAALPSGAVRRHVLMTIVAIRLLDRTGRRPLLLGGTTGMAAGMIVVALTFAIGGSQLHGGANFVVTISFLTLLSAIGNAGTFFLFAALSIVALAYFLRQVPETKNRSLPDIERGLDLPVRDALAKTGS